MSKDPKYTDVAQGQRNFPSRDVSEDQKDGPAYNLAYNQAIYNRFLNDKGGLAHSTRESMDFIRLYGKGAQPMSIYKSTHNERISDTETGVAFTDRTEKTRKGWENVSWRPISPLPRIKTIIKGYLDQVGQDVFVDAIDPLSNDDKENVKWSIWTRAQNMEFLSEFHLQAGIPMEELEFLPVNKTELNLFEAMGGLKANTARAMEKLIRHTEDISDVDDRLKDEWVDDAVDLGMVAAREIFDHSIRKFRYRYMDPRYLVMQFVQDDDYSRSEWAGYVEKWTISELKQVLPDVTEEFFKKVSFQYRGRFGNAGKSYDWNSWDNFSKHNTGDGSFNYDDFKVEVLETEWIDYKAERNLYYVRETGNASMKPLGKTSSVRLTSGQKARGSKDMKTRMRRLRGAKWIIGTDEVFDYGLVNMTDRPDKTNVMHSFRLYTLSDLPITEQLIPIADDMAIAWLQWQENRASLPKSSYAVDVAMMDNIDDGSDDWGFDKVFRAWKDTRYLFHQQSMSGKYEGGNTSPVQPIPSMLKDALEEFHMTWAGAVQRIEDVTGINLVMLGGTPREGSQVGTTQMAAEGAVNVFKPIIKIIGRLKKDLAQTTVRRLQLAFKARADIADVYKDVVGEADVEVLKQAEKDAVQYGMVFEEKPSAQMKTDLLGAAQSSLQARRDGKPGIDISQYMYISQQLESGGNIKELTSFLSYMNLKSEQQIQENKERDIQVQNEGLANINKQAQELEAQKQKGKLAEINLTGEWSLREVYAKEGLSNAQQSPVESTSPPGGTQPPPG